MNSMTISQRPCPEPGSVFQHTDGGLYRFITEALSADDKEPLYVYQHLWPFERLTWVRRRSEWASRFMEVAPVDATRAMAGDRAAAQAAIVSAKAARRSAEAALRAVDDARAAWAKQHFGALYLEHTDGSAVVLTWLPATHPVAAGEGGHFVALAASSTECIDKFLAGEASRVSQEEFYAYLALPNASERDR